MALPNATWAGNRIVTVVSRYAGLANDTNSRPAVLDHINLGLWEMSLHTPWDWLSTTASDITVVSGTSTYNLPTASGSEFDEVYDVRLVGGNERTLDFADRRSYDKAFRGVQGAQGVPTHYTLFGAQLGGQITLLPTPNVGDTLRIRYTLRQPTISDATGSSLAISDKFMPLVIYKGAELTTAWKRPEMAPYWKSKFDQLLARAIDVDRNKKDAMSGFVSQSEHGTERIDPLNPTDTAFYPP